MCISGLKKPQYFGEKKRGSAFSKKSEPVSEEGGSRRDDTDEKRRIARRDATFSKNDALWARRRVEGLVLPKKNSHSGGGERRGIYPRTERDSKKKTSL